MGSRKAVFLLVVVTLAAAVSGYDDKGQRWEGGDEGGRSEGGYEGRGHEGGYEGRQGKGGYEGQGREGGDEGRRWEGGPGRREVEEEFLLEKAKQVVRTEAGEMRVVRGFGGRFARNPLHIGFINMEPRSFFIPQYLDSSLILFVRRGEARVGHIYKDELVERTLKIGDIYRIAAGSAFYLINTAEGQRLHVICSIATSESSGWHPFQPFYIGGGTYPTSVLSGFDRLTLSTAFNVSEAELDEMLSRQRQGPIVYLADSQTPSPSLWSKFLGMGKHQRLASLRQIVVHSSRDDDAEEEEQPWSLRKLLNPFFGRGDRKGDDKRTTTGKGPDSYNLYDRKPDFKNNYGWSIALDESDYKPLRHENFGVYLVNLTAGSMMAPHINPRATEYGIVLAGTGRIQIVYPNGSLAMNAEVTEGDVFWIPRYFPFCQIASRTGPFEFFGFSTSARNNRPQFLVGAGSLLRTMKGPELAAAFGVSEDRLNEIITAQRESTILPSATVAPPGIVARPKLESNEMAEAFRSFGTAMRFN